MPSDYVIHPYRTGAPGLVQHTPTLSSEQSRGGIMSHSTGCFVHATPIMGLGHHQGLLILPDTGGPACFWNQANTCRTFSPATRQRSTQVGSLQSRPHCPLGK